MPIAIVFVVLTGLLVLRSIVIVPRDLFYVVERLGRVDRVLTAGVHVLPPFISRITARVPSGDQVVEVPASRCTARDGDDVMCEATIMFRVVDPAAAVAKVGDYRQALMEAVTRWLARSVGQVDGVAASSAPAEALADLEAVARSIGVAIVSVHPRVALSDRAMATLASQAAAERDERVARWAVERGDRLGRDGRPTDAQRRAYDEWLALEVRAHAREIETAKQLAAPPPADAAEALTPGPDAPAAPPPASRPTTATARSTMAPGDTGTVDADDRRWPARNVSSAAIAKGFPCAVVRREGDTLLVRAL